MERIKLVNKAYKNVSVFFKLLVVFACFASFGAWFFSGIDGITIHIIVLVLFVFVAFFNPHYFRYKKISNIWFLLLLIAVFFTTLRTNLAGKVDSVISVLPFIFLFSLKEDYKSEVLLYLLKMLGLCMGISLVGYIIHIVGIPLPHTYLSVGHYEFDNYYLFVESARPLDSLMPIQRFHFIFYEPGYTGCLVALLCYAFSYDFRNHKALYILAVTLFFTFSLAGWLIFVIGFILFRLKENKKRLSWILAIALFLISFVTFFKLYNNGNNIVNIAILQRLERQDNSGTLIAGYNRSSETLRDYFWNDFVGSKHALFGRPDYRDYFENEEVMIADWMAYVIRYGWIGLLSFLLFVYYPPIADKNNRYDMLVFSTLFILIFSQTIYLVYGYMYLTVLSLGFNQLKVNNLRRV